MAERQASAGQARATPTGQDGSSHDRGHARVLFIGDVVGGIGRRTLLESLPILRERYDPTFVVANGENVAGGLGITPKIADELIAAGIDAITLGNHTYHRREIYPYLDAQPNILRPVNFLRSQPGHGVCTVEHNGVRLGVINLSGNLYLRAGRSAFTEIEAALSELGAADHIIVDMHAEATSEKIAMGWHLDGRTCRPPTGACCRAGPPT
jgi:metallophosphoesterase (TIGR00282 family)